MFWSKEKKSDNKTKVIVLSDDIWCMDVECHMVDGHIERHTYESKDSVHHSGYGDYLHRARDKLGEKLFWSGPCIPNFYPNKDFVKFWTASDPYKKSSQKKDETE